MKNRFLIFALAALTVGLLGSCSKINERIDGLDNRVGNIENEKIASIENQIAAINASIADLGTIRKDITDLQVAVGAKGEDIAELKAADEALGKRIDELQTYVDTELAKYATTEWANATFATLEQLNTTNTELGALKETVGKLGETFDGKLADLKTELTNAINTAVSNLETRISTLEARVSALEQMIQTVTIVPAYDDGSVEVTDGVLELNLIVSPAGAVKTLTKENVNLLVNETRTKAVSVDTLKTENILSFIVDEANGTVEIKADINENLPSASDQALIVAVNVQNGISDFTTEFVPVYVKKTPISDMKYSKAVYSEEGGAHWEFTVRNDNGDSGYPVFILKAGPAYSGEFIEGDFKILSAVLKTSESESTDYKDNAGTVTITCTESGTVSKAGKYSFEVKAKDASGNDVILKAKEVSTSAKDAGGESVTLKDKDASDPDYKPVTGISFPDGYKPEVAAGTSTQVQFNLAPSDATNPYAYWASSDESVAIVDATGKVTGVKAGTATITATSVNGKKTATCTVTVTAPVSTFKAVYNTNGDANTLTFYYDAVDHSGEGITVYDNLPTAATTAADWGYNSNRGKIKSVKIDPSVASYSGLTSTAYMFQSMTTATSISGAEHLDVSNVTDMSWMFYNFGGGTSGSPTTLNVVPDVSKWNTGNVTNMTGMFAYYGNNSELDKVPDVSGWNTGKVTDMSFMFQKYGHESQTFNAVPDVSKWNTGNVTNMTNMFFEYGHKSTALNTVPNVSGWNTGKVTNMKQMFMGYGFTSTSINCVLDLSGWDLSKITGTNGADVFNFNPKTFNVTIPAKTGEKSNEGGKWYYGNEGKSIEPPTGKTFTILPAGALKGVFTVSDPDGTPNSGDEKKVRFSQGNLQATYNSSTSTYTWGFAPNQYDYIGNAAGNTTIDSQTNGAVVDLFGWSTDAASNNWGIHTKDASTYTTGNFKDWGEAIDNKGTWRTLSGGPGSEWGYLRDNHVYVYGTCNNVPGVFIAPDGFVGDASALSEAIKDWESALATGILFLPAAGYRCGSEVLEAGDYGYYWSSNLYNNSNAFCINFKFNGYSAPSTVLERLIGSSVRLVTEVPAAGDSGNGTEQYKNNSNPNWF